MLPNIEKLLHTNLYSYRFIFSAEIYKCFYIVILPEFGVIELLDIVPFSLYDTGSKWYWLSVLIMNYNFYISTSLIYFCIQIAISYWPIEFENKFSILTLHFLRDICTFSKFLMIFTKKNDINTQKLLLYLPNSKIA